MLPPRCLFLLPALFLALLGCAKDSTPPATSDQLVELDNVGVNVGKKAPEIIGSDVHGQPLKLSDYRGQVVVLEFWAVT